MGIKGLTALLVEHAPKAIQVNHSCPIYRNLGVLMLIVRRNMKLKLYLVAKSLSTPPCQYTSSSSLSAKRMESC